MSLVQRQMLQKIRLSFCLTCVRFARHCGKIPPIRRITPLPPMTNIYLQRPLNSVPKVAALKRFDSTLKPKRIARPVLYFPGVATSRHSTPCSMG